jgi:hypothetical protein
VPFLIETLKAWNKLHDPATDGIIQAYNYCTDALDGQFDKILTNAFTLQFRTDANNALLQLLNKQGNVGRC